MKKLLFTLSTLLLSVTSFAQGIANSSGGLDQKQELSITVLEHALLNCVSPTHDFDITAPVAAGDPITIGDATFISYLQTSMITVPGYANAGSLTVAMTGLNGGFILKLMMTPPNASYGYAGQQDGNFGAAGGQAIVNSTPYILLSQMGSHYTQKGASDGWKSTITLAIDPNNYGLISANSTPVVLQYTLAN